MKKIITVLMVAFVAVVIMVNRPVSTEAPLVKSKGAAVPEDLSALIKAEVQLSAPKDTPKAPEQTGPFHVEGGGIQVVLGPGSGSVK